MGGGGRAGCGRAVEREPGGMLIILRACVGGEAATSALPPSPHPFYSPVVCPPGPDRVFSFTPNTTMLVNVGLCGGFNPVLAVLDSNLQPVACTSDVGYDIILTSFANGLPGLAGAGCNYYSAMMAG